jgi:hypothetical protein
MLLNVAPVQGLSLGFILPGIFNAGLDGQWNNNRSFAQQAPWLDLDGVNDKSNFWNGNPGRRFIQDSLERMTFGIKYEASGLGVAAQFGLRGRPEFKDDELVIKDSTFLNSVMYLGLTYNITSQMNAQLEARGEFFKSFGGTDETDNVSRTALAIGGRFSFNDGPLGASLGILYWNDIATTGDGLVGMDIPAGNIGIEGGVLRLNPNFRYDVVPSHLRFALDTRIDLPLSEWTLDGYDPRELQDKNEYADGDDFRGPGGPRAYTLGYELKPELFFNFLGTGATGSVNQDNNFTGIVARYRLNGKMYTGDLFNKYSNNPTRNSFDLIFRWTF